jgi:hypothetical protein
VAKLVVIPNEVDGWDLVREENDARHGVKPAFFALAAILLFVTILVAVLSLTGALTGFGS